MELPRDVHNKIISNLDIDTRRSLDIYIKLTIPKNLQDKITKCFRPILCYVMDHEEEYPYKAYVIEVIHKPVRTLYHKYIKYYQISHEIFEKDVIYNIRQYYSDLEYINPLDIRTKQQRDIDKIRNLNNPDYVEAFPDEEFENVQFMKSTYYGLPDRSVRTTAVGSTDDQELIDTHYYGEEYEIQMGRMSYATVFRVEIKNEI